MTRLGRTAVALTTLALLATGCGGGSGDSGSNGGTGDERADNAAEELTPSTRVVARVASFDVATGEDQRLLVGLFTSDRGIIGGGEIDVRVGYLGEEQPSADDQIEMSDATPATFLPVPGKEPEVGDSPTVIEGSGAGVYEARVDFDQPGFWNVQVSVPLEGEQHTANAVVHVGEEHRVPAAGDPAPATENPTIESGDVEPIELDSRAQGEDGEVPDPELHDAVISDVLAEGRPMVVVISTPVYCTSQFCGPITEYVAGLEEQYGDRAEFVHLEVWQDFQSQELNPAAKEWIFDRETGGNEPWVFLVGADGTVQARWDNVLDGQALTSMLEELPAS